LQVKVFATLSSHKLKEIANSPQLLYKANGAGGNESNNKKIAYTRIPMLSENDLQRICHSVKKGAKLLVGRDHTGRQKIKLIKGPFGLFVERLECSEKDLAFIRQNLSKSRDEPSLSS
jgi:hypothetical protein